MKRRKYPHRRQFRRNIFPASANIVVNKIRGEYTLHKREKERKTEIDVYLYVDSSIYYKKFVNII